LVQKFRKNLLSVWYVHTRRHENIKLYKIHYQ